MLNPDFRDMLSAFCEEKVEFMVVGAYAVAFHGMPRATGDIDLWIRCSDENAQRVWNALINFGAPLFDLTIDDIKKPNTVFQMGIEPQRIGILTSIAAVDFDEAWVERRYIEIENLSVPIIGRKHLLKNKKAIARPKDMGDIAWLEKEEI